MSLKQQLKEIGFMIEVGPDQEDEMWISLPHQKNGAGSIRLRGNFKTLEEEVEITIFSDTGYELLMGDVVS
jgi:hypothetical protein